MDELPENNPQPSTDGITEQSLRGEVEKVLFENRENGYAVAQLRDGSGVLHTIVGQLAGIAPGQGLDVKGCWDTHKDYGRQLRVVSYTQTLPVTPEAIVKYLSSGVVRGLGEKNAEAIVKTFGARTLDIIENYPARLKEVPGIGKKRIESIREVWKENASRRNLQMHLQSYGVSPAYFVRIFKEYGEAAADKIHENPYCLASDIPGIGFLSADRIAAKTGIAGNDPRRLAAGVKYAMEQLNYAGHTCAPEDYFLEQCARLLNVEPADAVKGLAAAVSMMTAAVRTSRDGHKMVYDPLLLRCEEELPSMLANLASAPRHAGEKTLPYQVAQNASFSDEQLLAVRSAGRYPLSIITGGPGVGKTTVVGEIVRRASLAKLKLYLCAPTGRAAKRMSETTRVEAYTIHRLLKWDPVNRKFIHGSSLPLFCDVLIMDETSMLDLPLATALFRAIRRGTTVVIVGDSDQLPSVGPGNVLNDLIQSRRIPVTRLTRIFRQGPGSGIIRAAHDVNSGILPRTKPLAPNAPMPDFFWIEKDDPDEVSGIIERLVCDRIPARFGLDPRKDIQILSPMNRGSCGTAALNLKLQSMLNPSEKMAMRLGDRIFKRGDKVMQISNNYDKNVFNGDMGMISSIDFAARTFTVKFDCLAVDYLFSELDQLTLSYAVTIHKSQGSEFPAVIIPLLSQHYMMLQRNLLYTGITRAKKLMVLVASEKAVSMAVRNIVSEPRYTLLKERLADAFGGGR